MSERAADDIDSFGCWLDGAIVRMRDGTVFKVRECPEQIIELVLGLNRGCGRTQLS